jgi:hypothetical protein
VQAIRGNKPAKRASVLVFLYVARLTPTKHPNPAGCAFYLRRLKTVKHRQAAQILIFPYFSSVFSAPSAKAG